MDHRHEMKRTRLQGFAQDRRTTATYPHRPDGSHRTSFRRRARPRPPRPPAGAASATPGAIVEFRDVSKRYDSGDVGLDRVSFAVQPGEFVFLVGASGSGKSTTMRLLIKETEPTEGSIARRRARADRHPAPAACPTTAATSAWSSRTTSCCPNRTVYDNVAYALQVTGGTRREIREKVPDILRLTGLSRSCTTTPTSSRAASSSASPSRARSSTTRRCCWPTSRPATSIPRPRSGSCSCSTGSTARARPCVVATHDVAMVDKMRRRVIELSAGKRRPRRAAPAATARTPRRRRRSSATGCGCSCCEVRLLPPRGAARAQAQRRAVVRGDGDGARHRAGPRRVHPDRPGHDRRGQRGPRQGDRRRLPEDERDAGGRRPRPRRARSTRRRT